MQEKRCGRCRETVAITDFTPSQRALKGAWCKACTRVYRMERKAGRKPYAPKRDVWNCLACGADLSQKRADAKTCSRRCESRLYLRNNPRRYQQWAYGIDHVSYLRLLALQGNACAICGTLTPKGSWNTDHCHETGEVRGVLCGHCNTGLGRFRDDPAVLIRAAEYLRNPPARMLQTPA